MKKLQRLFANKSLIKSLYSKQMFGFAAAGTGFALSGGHAHGQTIISDDFNEYGTGVYQEYSTAGTWPGTKPDLADLPGGVWRQINGFVWGQGQIQGMGWYSNPYPVSIGNTNQNGTGMAISIATSASYVEPNQLSISAGVAIEANGNNPAQNIYELGFYAAGTSFSYYNYQNSNFTGLSLDESGGLSLLVDGNQIGSTVAYVGTFNPNALDTLSFDVNSATGTISDILFQGSTANYSSLESGSGLFTASNIAYAGNLAAGPQNDNGSATANFVVMRVTPEPSTYALFASGLLALGAFGYRRRRQMAGF